MSAKKIILIVIVLILVKCGYDTAVTYRDVKTAMGDVKLITTSATIFYKELGTASRCNELLKGHSFAVLSEVPLQLPPVSGQSFSPGAKVGQPPRTLTVQSLTLRDSGLNPIPDPEGSGNEVRYAEIVYQLKHEEHTDEPLYPFILPLPVVISKDSTTIEKCLDMNKYPPKELCNQMKGHWEEKEFSTCVRQ